MLIEAAKEQINSAKSPDIEVKQKLSSKQQNIFTGTYLMRKKFSVMTENLCLQWNDFKENVNSAFGKLREDRELTDVTLACEDGQHFEAHKVILAALSPFFGEMIFRSKHPHPLHYRLRLRL